MIIRAVTALPETLDPDLVIQAERPLVAAAREHNARTLTILGRRLGNGGLLCPRHHARAHDPSYELARHPTGKISFHRRT